MGYCFTLKTRYFYKHHEVVADLSMQNMILKIDPLFKKCCTTIYCVKLVEGNVFLVFNYTTLLLLQIKETCFDSVIFAGICISFKL